MDADAIIRIVTEVKELEQKRTSIIEHENSIRMRMTDLEEELNQVMSGKEDTERKIAELKKNITTALSVDTPKEEPKKEPKKEPKRRHWTEDSDNESDDEADDGMEYFKEMNRRARSEKSNEVEDTTSVSTDSSRRHVIDRYGFSVFVSHILQTMTEEEITDHVIRKLKRRGVEYSEFGDISVRFTSRSKDQKYKVGFINNLGKKAYEELLSIQSLDIGGWYINLNPNIIDKPKRFR